MLVTGDRRFSVPCMLDQDHPGDCTFESDESGTAHGIYLAAESQYMPSTLFGDLA